MAAGRSLATGAAVFREVLKTPVGARSAQRRKGKAMRILVVGSGGREHALVWRAAQHPTVAEIYCAPGNAGIAQLARCVDIPPDQLDALADFARAERIDLTIVGPEAPLIAGIVDRFESRGLRIFGPSPDPARIEGSKSFAKKLMQTSGVPTATFWVCDSLSVAQARVRDYYATHGPETGLVVKADGLAAGKGVVVAGSQAEAEAAVEQIMGQHVFGAAGDHVVIEERLAGPEASLMALTDGRSVAPLLMAQDSKRAGERDTGPNTGGMGALCPIPTVSPEQAEDALNRITRPTLDAIRGLGIPYRGVLYAGLMLTEEGPKCIEFNCRFGDPETQVVLPLLETDLLELLIASVDCTLENVKVKWKPQAAVCVVAAARGYPGPVERGRPISGLEDAERMEDVLVFHAGTRREGDRVVTNGGRVLNVVGLAADVESAAARAYAALSRIHFDGMWYRRDIAMARSTIPA